MAIFSRHYFANCKYKTEIAEQVIAELRKQGYVPLIATSKEALASIWGKQDPKDLPFRINWVGASESNHPLSGDLFLSDAQNGLLYVALFASDNIFKHPRLQIGGIGDSNLQGTLAKFLAAAKRVYPNRGRRKWRVHSLISTRFASFSKEEGVQFSWASDISQARFEQSRLLEDSDSRSLALKIKTAGGVLESDLRKVHLARDEEPGKSLQALLSANLLEREFVVICRRSSTQILRLQGREKLHQMSDAGALCSCGAPILTERIEEFIRPSRALVDLLNGSSWMNAKLVEALVRASISKSRILLGIQEGSEEVDALADYNGSILMFEMKDGQFSMKHAYSFGARMAIYRPEFAVIVATKGVAPEVKAHFERIKPDPKIYYVDNFENLTNTVAEIIDKMQSKFAMNLLTGFESLMTFNMPIARNLGRRVGLDEEVVRTTPDFEDLKSNSTYWRR